MKMEMVPPTGKIRSILAWYAHDILERDNVAVHGKTCWIMMILIGIVLASGCTEKKTEPIPADTPIQPAQEDSGSSLTPECYAPLVYLLTKFSDKNDSVYLTIFLKRKYSLYPFSRNFLSNWEEVKTTLNEDYHAEVDKGIIDFIRGSRLDVRVEMSVEDFRRFVNNPPPFVEYIGMWDSPATAKIPRDQPMATEILYNSSSPEEAYNRTVELYNTLYGEDYLEKYGDRVLPMMKRRINETFNGITEGVK